MTDNYDEDFDSDIESDENESGDIKSLRRAARGNKKLESENQILKRQLAFIKAGIDPDDPKMRYFVKGYEGELSAEAVRQAALEAGFLASQSSEDPQKQAVASAEQRVASASHGAIFEDASEEAALARMEQAMEEGGIDAMLEVAHQLGMPISIEQ
jgi:ribosomal protein L12E/L44/L45/RPP1/RPP2